MSSSLQQKWGLFHEDWLYKNALFSRSLFVSKQYAYSLLYRPPENAKVDCYLRAKVFKGLDPESWILGILTGEIP